MKPFAPTHLQLAAAAILCFTLSACGGGGDASTASTNTTDSAGTMDAASVSSSGNPDSSSATEVSQEATTAAEATLVSTQAVVTAGPASQTVNCPGGGTAVYTVTGGIDDSTLTTGEVYSLSFNQCKGSAGAVAVNGSATVTIDEASLNTVSATLAYNALTAKLTRSSLVLSGSATMGVALERTFTQEGIAQTRTASFTADSLAVTRSTSARSTTYGLSAVDITQTTKTLADVVTSTSLSGTASFVATWPSKQYSATFQAQGDVSFTDGQPTAGQWQVATPNTLITVVAANGTVTVAIDLGKDGVVDRTQSYPLSDWVNSVQ
jgi:hypothetical protein